MCVFCLPDLLRKSGCYIPIFLHVYGGSYADFGSDLLLSAMECLSRVQEVENGFTQHTKLVEIHLHRRYCQFARRNQMIMSRAMDRLAEIHELGLVSTRLKESLYDWTLVALWIMRLR